MKVYNCPNEVPAPEPDYTNFNLSKIRASEEAHRSALKQWLKDHGYTGANTGEIVRFPVGDGRAQYMYADGGKRSCLIHLPYGDAYHYPDVEFLPRREIMRRLQQQKNW